MFRKLCFGLALAIVSTSSLAADLEPYAAPPRMVSVYDWAGFYAGVNAGYGYATLNRELRDVFGNSSVPVNENLSGVSGGALVGANSQFGQFVVGGEIDIQFATQTNSTTTVQGIQFTDKLSQFATVRARFGYATGNMLYYLTVGSMATRFENTVTTGFTVTSSALRPGWAFGGGFEAVMVDQLILRTEVLFMQTPQHNENLGFGIKASDSSTNTVARVAVLYKFGGGYKPQPAMRP